MKRYENIQGKTTFLCERCRQRFPESELYEYIPHLRTLLRNGVPIVGGKIRMFCSKNCFHCFLGVKK